MITSLGHATSHDVTFNGYMIPAESIILADFDSVFHDSTVWKEPDDFRPQRFIAEDGSVLKIEEHIPFFVGKSCNINFLRSPITCTYNYVKLGH